MRTENILRQTRDDGYNSIEEARAVKRRGQEIVKKETTDYKLKNPPEKIRRVSWHVVDR